MITPDLTLKERREISEILTRRSNEIAGYHSDYRRADTHFGSVELALNREIDRLRHLAVRVNPPAPDNDED